MPPKETNPLLRNVKRDYTIGEFQEALNIAIPGDFVPDVLKEALAFPGKMRALLKKLEELIRDGNPTSAINIFFELSQVGNLSIFYGRLLAYRGDNYDIPSILEQVMTELDAITGSHWVEALSYVREELHDMPENTRGAPINDIFDAPLSEMAEAWTAAAGAGAAGPTNMPEIPQGPHGLNAAAAGPAVIVPQEQNVIPVHVALPVPQAPIPGQGEHVALVVPPAEAHLPLPGGNLAPDCG